MDLSYWNTHQSDVMTYAGQHIRLTLTTLAISLAIAVPLGTLIAKVRILYAPLMSILGVIYTIPSLALLAVLTQYVGIGAKSALIALVAYAQFILVRNVVVGLHQVSPAVLDAARGMGMNPVQTLFRIEYPLALPVILGGIRIATVATIAITTIAFLDDAGGLGQLLFDGVTNGSNSEIEVGAVAVSLMAIAADIILRIMERFLPASRARASARS